MISYVDIIPTKGEVITNKFLGKAVKDFIGKPNSPKCRRELQESLENQFDWTLEDITTEANITGNMAVFKKLS